MMQPVRCGNVECRIQLDEPQNLPSDLRQPCPRCGAVSRCFEDSACSHVTLACHLMLSGKRGSSKGRRPILEFKSGDSLHHASARWMVLEQTVDRENNRYRKRVVDSQTGEILRDVDHPLTDHQGYGSAKKKAPKPT